MSIGTDRRWQRLHRAATSAAMKELALKRRCPDCKRKSALSKRIDGDYVEKTCRYCGWSKGYYLNIASEALEGKP